MTEDVRTVDPLDVMKKSHRFDLIFKIELADAWLHGEEAAIRTAEEAYLESIRARNGFCGNDPPKSGPAAYVRSFRQTLASISACGYDEKAPPIPVDETGELLGGAHRLSACIACGCSCQIARMPMSSTGGSRLVAFRRGRMAAEVVNWGMRAYLRRFPDGCLADELATKVGPDAPFPDWTLRVRELRLDSWLWRLREKGFLLKAAVSKGARRAKALKKANECRHRASAPSELASYWREHEGKKG